MRLFEIFSQIGNRLPEAFFERERKLLAVEE